MLTDKQSCIGCKAISLIVVTPDINYIDDILSTGDFNHLPSQIFFITAVQPISPDMYARAHQKCIQIIELKNYSNDHELDHHVDRLLSKYNVTHIIAPNEIDIMRAARLRERLHLPGLTVAQARAFTDKHLMKHYLNAHGLQVPAYALIHTPEDLMKFAAQNQLPIIIKPLQGTGCQGIMIFKTTIQLQDFCCDKLRFHEPFLAEQYIQGKLYNINGVVSDHKVVAVWPSLYWRAPDQLLLGKSASSFLMSDINPLTPILNDYACRVIKAMPGPPAYTFHLEAFIQDHQIDPVFCEIAVRVGGKGVNQSWKCAFDINLKNIDFHIQTGTKLPAMILPLKPKILCAEVWFPQTEGRLISKADYCPFDWVKNYQSLAIVGKNYPKPHTIENILGGSSLIVGHDESDIIDKINEFEKWFYENHRIELSKN